MILPQAESLETSALAVVLQATHSGTRSLFTQSPGSTSVNRDDAGPSCHATEDRGSEERLPEDRDNSYCSPCLPNLTSPSKVSSDSTSSRKPSLRPFPTAASVAYLWVPIVSRAFPNISHFTVDCNRSLLVCFPTYTTSSLRAELNSPL